MVCSQHKSWLTDSRRWECILYILCTVRRLVNVLRFGRDWKPTPRPWVCAEVTATIAPSAHAERKTAALDEGGWV